jgi:hypothetical protein
MTAQEIDARVLATEPDYHSDWRKGVGLIASALGEANPPDLCCVRLADKILRIRDEHERALNFLEWKGYRRCDTPACNCGSWHKQEDDR